MSTKLLGRPKSHLSFSGSSFSDSNKFQTLWPKEPLFTNIGYWQFPWPQGRNRLVPRSHIVQTHRFLFVTTKIMALKENYLWPANTISSMSTKPRWIPKWTRCNKLGHQQVVHIPHSLQALCVLDVFQSDSQLNSAFGSQSIPNQHILSALQRCIIDSAQDKPANPFSKKAQRHTKFISTFVQAQPPASSRSLESY
jgi:hypothetical protein